MKYSLFKYIYIKKANYLLETTINKKKTNEERSNNSKNHKPIRNQSTILIDRIDVMV